MRGIGGEPLLLGDVGLQLLEHRVEDVGEVAELVAGAGRAIRCESDPCAASRAASPMRSRGASIRPASNQPPPSPRASSTTMTTEATGTNALIRSERFGTKKSM